MEKAGDGPNYRSGQGVLCKVIAAEPGGYVVHLLPGEVEGFLPSQEQLQIGEQIPAMFVCMHENRALMSFAYMVGTTSKVQSGLGSESETAFAVWADSHPRNFKVRRAMDLIVPPDSTAELKSFKAGTCELSILIDELERSGHTGCVKVYCDEKYSRSSLLLYRGRCVSCIYGKKQKADFWTTEAAIQLTLADLLLPDTRVQIYKLPDQVILPMSALFLGYPVEPKPGSSVQSYVEYLLNWFAQKKQTAAIALALPSVPALCLSFIHEGNFYGSFYVEEQKFHAGTDFLFGLIGRDSEASMQTFVLPPEMTSDSVRFGYGLTIALSRFLLTSKKK